MKRFLVLVSCAFLLFSCPALCGAQESGKRITPSPRIVLPFYAGASAITDAPLGDTAAFNFGVEMLGLRLSAKSSPLEANAALRFSGTFFRPERQVFHLGVPVRVAYKFGQRSKAYAGASAEMRVGGVSDYSRFLASVEGGVSFYGFGLRAAYTVTPVYGGSRAVSLGLIIGL